MMKTTLLETDGKMVVVLSGELDTVAAAETEAALQPLFDCVGKDLVLDCTELEYITSSGLNILMNLLKTAQPKGERVILKNVNEGIRNILDLTGFVSYFEFE